MKMQTVLTFGSRFGIDIKCLNRFTFFELVSVSRNLSHVYIRRHTHAVFNTVLGTLVKRFVKRVEM